MKRRGRWLAVLGAAVLLQVLLWIAQNGASRRPLQGDEPMYFARAVEWAHGAPSMPTFIWPPGQEAFLGGLFALFGADVVPVAVAQGALLLAAGALFRSVLLSVGFPGSAATFAMALLVLDPQVASFAQYLWPEVPHLFLVLLAMWLLFGGERKASRAVLAGFSLGLALVTKSVLGPYVVVISAAAAMQGSPVALSRRFARFAAVMAPVLLVVGLVTIGNYVTFGVPRVGSSFTFNLWVGLNDPPSRSDYYSVVAAAGTEYLNAGATPEEREKVCMARVREKVVREGIGNVLVGQARKQPGHFLDRECFFTDQLPGGRWGPRRAATGLESLLGVYSRVVWGATLVLATFGAFLFPWPARWRLAFLPAGFLAMNLVLFFFIHVKTRYRVPILPTLDFFAASLFAWGSAASGVGGRRGAIRIAGATVVSALLLAVAFDLV